MLWMKVLRKDRDALGEGRARLPLFPPTFLFVPAPPCTRHWDDAQLWESVLGDTVVSRFQDR